MNQHIRTIAILGAGAVGSYLVMGLSDKYKENLWVIADGERKDRLAKNGLNINDKVYSLHIKTPAEAHGVDLLFVCTKYTQLRDSLPDIETITDKHTMVVSLLNGVDSEELIGPIESEIPFIFHFQKATTESTSESRTSLPARIQGLLLLRRFLLTHRLLFI